MVCVLCGVGTCFTVSWSGVSCWTALPGTALPQVYSDFDRGTDDAETRSCVCVVKEPNASLRLRHTVCFCIWV